MFSSNVESSRSQTTDEKLVDVEVDDAFPPWKSTECIPTRFVCRVISNPLCFFPPPTPVDQIRPLSEDIHHPRSSLFSNSKRAASNEICSFEQRRIHPFFSLPAFNAFQDSRFKTRFQSIPLPSFVLLLVLQLNQFHERGGIHRWSLEKRRDSVSIPFSGTRDSSNRSSSSRATIRKKERDSMDKSLFNEKIFFPPSFPSSSRPLLILSPLLFYLR